MENIEVIKSLRNCTNVNYEYRAEGASCSKCPYKKISHCKYTMMRDAADALEMDEQRIVEQQKQITKLYILLNNRINEIAELETDKKTLINVVKDKSDFHTTKDAMRIAELEAQLPKEGEWLDETDGCYFWHGKCSICNYEYNIDSYYADMNYCPNCGAKMKESKRITNIRGDYQQPSQSATINTASQSATINVGTTFLCRSTGKLCQNTTEYGYCKHTTCTMDPARE